MSSRNASLRKTLAFEKLAGRKMLTTFALANNSVLEAIDAQVFVDDQGQGTLEMDVTARKLATANTFYVDEQFAGDGSATNPFADIRDALAEIDSQGLSSATIQVAAGDYTWGDAIRDDPNVGSTTFNANLNVIGAGSNLTRVQQQPGERTALTFDEPGKSLYVEGISFLGDESSLGDVFEARRGKNLTLVDTQLRDSAEGDGLFVLNFQTVVIVDSAATGNGADGFSYTHGSDSGPPMYVLEANVLSEQNGTNGRSSSQGSSTHRATEIVRVNSIYRNNPTNLEDTGLTSWNVGLTTENATVAQSGGNVNFRVRGDKTEIADGLAWLISGNYGDGGVVSAWATRANDANQTPIFGNIKVSSLFDTSQHPSSVLTVSTGATLDLTPDDSQLVVIDDPPTEPPVEPPTEPPVVVEPPVVEPPVEPPLEPPTIGDDLATVYYKNRETKIDSDEVEFQVHVSNDSGTERNFKDAEIRYYFTPDGLDPVFNLKNSNAPVNVTYVPDGSYVSIQVTDDFVLPNGKRWKVRLEIENEEDDDFDQSNDPSFEQTGVELEQTDAIDIIFAGDAPNVDPPTTEPPTTEPPTTEPPTTEPPTTEPPTTEPPTTEPPTTEPPTTEPPVVDPPAEPPADPSDSSVRLVYLNKQPNLVTDQIEAQVEIYNETDTEQNFKGLEVRYYMHADGLSPNVSVTRTNAPDSGIEASFVDTGVVSFNYVSFNVTEDYVVQSGNRLKLRFEISNEENGDFNQANDLSFDNSSGGRFESGKVAVFLDGELLWGDFG